MEVTQERFDALVKEIMTDFELNWEEAVADAVQELRTQGVTNFSKLLTAPVEERERHDFSRRVSVHNVDLLHELGRELEGSATLSQQLLDSEDAVKELRNALDLAVEEGEILPTPSAIRKYPSNASVIKATRARALRDGRWTSAFVQDGGLDVVVKTMNECQYDEEIFPASCSLMRALACPDDTKEVTEILGCCRVLCRSKNSSAANVPSLVYEGSAVEPLMNIGFDAHGGQRSQLSALNTLNFLARTDDVIEVMREAQVVPSVLSALRVEMTDPEMTLLLLSLLRNLCGNQQCRSETTDNNGIGSVLEVMGVHEHNARIQELALSALAAISLGSSSRAQIIANMGGIEVGFKSVREGSIAAGFSTYDADEHLFYSSHLCRIIHNMKAAIGVLENHTGHDGAIRAACNAIRNLGSRSKEVRDLMKSFPRAESLLRKAQRTHPEVSETVHVALREFNMLQDAEYYCPFQSQMTAAH
ncbi:hypothetical protein NDN08_000680 [Rhodosorus marinus]|uniref:Armadillo repeat-containing protein 6 n=1 Tax=Rhodosorus marinus TaxID=101924 RepID=A0AAV8URF9_9RHOD|nr:hypothetical protein NDN08_000680 [Rhodosorus marinus]